MHKEAITNPGLGLVTNLAIVTLLIPRRDKMFAVVVTSTMISNAELIRASTLDSQRYSAIAADSARTSGWLRFGVSTVTTGDLPSGWTFFSSGGASLSLPRLYVLSSYGIYRTISAKGEQIYAQRTNLKLFEQPKYTV